MNIFKNNIFVRIAFFAISLIFQFIVISNIIDRTVSNWSLFFWISSLILLYAAFPFISRIKNTENKTSFRNFPIILSIILFGIIIRIFLMLNTTSFHIDEYLTAHYSYSLGDLSKLDWFGMYPPVGEWICQFPLLYFFFQKLFFNIFGLSTLTMRFSILPYITIIFVSLFLLTKRLYNEKTAITAILIFAIFSPDLYLSRWSLHFVSSTALFLLTAIFLRLVFKLARK